MEIRLVQGKAQVASPVVGIGSIVPCLNGRVLDDWPASLVQAGPEAFTLRFDAPYGGRGRFGIQGVQESVSRAYLRYWVEDLPADTALDAFGLRLGDLTPVRAWYRSGYTSWDGSYYVSALSSVPERAPASGAETGYAVTQVLPENGHGCLTLGFDRHERFQQSFTWTMPETGGVAGRALIVQTLWDQKACDQGARTGSERLYLLEGGDAEEGLREWAYLVASASPIPPRHGRPLIGWCSWYNLYANINEAVILEHLRGLARVVRDEALPMWFFQIDDGFTPEMGDWLEVKPEFPRGMKPLLDDIRAAGFAPGLWIAPFMVGNRSHLYAEHPDWVIRDRRTGGPLTKLRFYGEFRWHKRSEEYYVLDATHPEAFAYLRAVFRTWRRDWGCEYFKTDFMEFGSAYGPDQAMWHTPGLTRMEIWRQVAEMIRAEIGDAAWLGCGCPLWAGVGLVDGVRVGRDMGVEWRGERPALGLLRDLATRSFANGILWQADPDCILLRDRYHFLSEAEVRSLALYAGMLGGVLTTSDALEHLSPGRLALWKLLANPRPQTCCFPGLADRPGVYEPAPASGEMLLFQVRGVAGNPRAGRPGDVAILAFNAGDAAVERTVLLADLGIDGARYVWDAVAGRRQTGPLDRLGLALAPHDAVLLFISPAPWGAAPEQLP